MHGEALFAIDNVKVEHLLEGVTTSLGAGHLQLIKASVTVPLDPSRPGSSAGMAADAKLAAQPLSTTTNNDRTDEWLLMTVTAQGDAEPFYELPIPSSSRIVTTPPSSYIIPNTIATSDDAGFIKLTLPPSIDTESRETFESILWNQTSFSTTIASTRAPDGSNDLPPSYADPSLRSKLVLVNQKGDVLGTLSDSLHLQEDPTLSIEGQEQKHEKEPVVVEATDSKTSPFDFSVRPISEFRDTPNPTNSSIITAGDWISKGIIVGAEGLARSFEWGADRLTSKPPTDKPMTFSPTAQNRADKANQYTGQVVKVSGKAAAAIGEVATNVGARIGKATGLQQTADGKPPKGLRGVVNKSLVAFNTVVDSLETGGKTLLASGTKSTTQVVNHRYGPEAAQLSSKVGTSVQHVALVYIDARGVSRKALLKSVGKGAFKAKMADGREVVLTNENDRLQLQDESTYSTTSPASSSSAQAAQLKQ
ncbi:hypothetical protein OIO90_000739 [Microbotryomycetes sp. JL221]|nr:hypothetical protein OIO90_000739 [Microbotryomycetes sp. JL221]